VADIHQEFLDAKPLESYRCRGFCVLCRYGSGADCFRRQCAGGSDQHEGRSGHKGFDPVSYFDSGEATEGSSDYALRLNGVTYRFSSADNLQRFKSNPTKFAPQYGGYCAYAMSLNRIADIDPARWAIVDGKLYLNNGFVAQSLWSLNKRSHIESADKNWTVFPKQPVAKGGERKPP
jgi:YHS domain-containing protein